MDIGAWWLDFKLERVGRKMKRLHHRQKVLRDRLHELEAKHRDGKVTAVDFDAQRAKLEGEKTAATEAVSRLANEEAALKQERKRRKSHAV